MSYCDSVMEGWSNGFGELRILEIFRCNCGKLCAMADQPNGNAAMVHASPRCDRFEALSDQRSALAYFFSIEQLSPTPELLAQLERETVSC